jgi:hypothetical protein
VPPHTPTFRSTTWIESRVSGAEKTRPDRDTRSRPSGSDCSAVKALEALGVPLGLPQHADKHRPQRPVSSQSIRSSAAARFPGSPAQRWDPYSILAET